MKPKEEMRPETLAPFARLQDLIGQERPIDQVSREICLLSPRLGGREVGAMHITCADESELECQQAFQQGFVQYLLPKMKFAHQAPFRLTNLGARHEWGAVPIAEDHFATRPSDDGFKLLVIKINAHVGAEWSGAPETFGHIVRYGRESTCCGALNALLGGGRRPFLDELRDAFGSEGKDRLAALRDPARVQPEERALRAALVSARLQARRVILEIQDHAPRSPTLYLVLPCVSLNREKRDGEILCGLYSADHRGEQLDVQYVGLEDDPAAYHVRKERDRYVVEDPGVADPRLARDHRELVMERWRRSSRDFAVRDDRLQRFHEEVILKKHLDRTRTRTLLKSLLLLLGEISPVSAAVLLFAEGTAGIHHAFRAHRLATELNASEDAREILEEIEAKVEHLEPERARALIELLIAEHCR